MTLLVVEKKCGGDEAPRITFGHLSPFPYIVLRYVNVTYKALVRASPYMYNALHSCVVSMNTYEYLRSAVQTYLFTFASTGFMSILRWALKNVHS